MPTASVEAAAFLTYRGVTIYHVYKDDNVDNVRREFLFSIDPHNSADCSFDEDRDFDVRDFPFFPQREPSELNVDQAIRFTLEQSIYHGLITTEGIRLQNPVKYNHALDLGFTVVSDHNADTLTSEEILAGLRYRLEELEKDPGQILEACGTFDTYENSPEKA